MRRTETEIYNAARDVNGKYNACILTYTPGVSITVLFAGVNWKENWERFVKDGWVTRRDHTSPRGMAQTACINLQA